MLNRDLLDKLLHAFDVNDRDTILEFFAEDGTWEILGYKTMKGKADIKAFIAQNTIDVVEAKKHRVIISGDTAVVDVEGKCKDGKGNVFENWCCDILEFEGSKVKSLKSFVVDKK